MNEAVTKKGRGTGQTAPGSLTPDFASSAIAQIISVINEPVILVSRKGVPILANPPAKKLLELDPVGQPMEKLVRKLNLLTTRGLPVSHHDFPVKQALEGHSVAGEQFTFVDRKRNTRSIWFSAYPLIQQKAVSGVIIVVREVFKENPAGLSDLERESSALKAIFDSAPEAIVVVDDNCRIIMSNPKSRWLYEQLDSDSLSRLEAIRDRPHSELPSSEIIALPLSRTVFKGEVIYDYEMELNQPGKPVKHILINTSPIWDLNGKITGGVGIFHDITERKLEKLELQRIRRELANRVETSTRELLSTVQTLKSEISERVSVENKLRLSEAKLKRISKKMLDTLEADRKTIAKELHDSIGASLAAIKFSLEEKLCRMTSTPPDDLVSLESIVSYLMDTIKETKRISANLRPSTMDDLGLSATITWFCREFQNFYKKIEINQNIEIEENDISETMKIVIYRIIQEAMTNAAKHGRPGRIDLGLNKRGQEVCLTIIDDGLGFDPEAQLISTDPMSGHGILGMKERAEICGGNVNIESKPKVGTRVEVIIPVVSR